MKLKDIDLRFLRLFSKFRETEEQRRQLFERANDLAQEKNRLQKKVVSDSNLIESLNRYIEALEGKAEMQTELIRELKQKLKTLLPRNKRTFGRA